MNFEPLVMELALSLSRNTGIVAPTASMNSTLKETAPLYIIYWRYSLPFVGEEISWKNIMSEKTVLYAYVPGTIGRRAGM